jgi:hypothetical protein
MLRRVESYGTLILTSQEMGQFISEVESEVALLDDRSIEGCLKEILRLARMCMENRALELHLEGD